MTVDLYELQESPRIAIIGCGKMGEAAMAGWISCCDGAARALSPDDFVAIAPSQQTRDRISKTHDVDVLPSVEELADIDGGVDIFVLAVKPQIMSDVLEQLSSLDITKDKLVITMAAGLPLGVYEKALPGARVVRVMPNMPLQVGMGASACAGGSLASKEDTEFTRDLFASLGIAEIVDESQIDAVCAISGAGPAYVAYMVEALRDAGVSAGLDEELAERLALQSVGGTFKAMSTRNVSPEEMRRSVCSPGGTTLAALSAMDDAGFKEMFASGVDAAILRANELAG